MKLAPHGSLGVWRVGSGRVGSGRVGSDRVGPGQEVSKSRGSVPVASGGFQISRVGSGLVKRF